MLSIIIPANNLVKKINPKYFYKKVFSLDDTINSIVKNIDVEYEIILVINDYSKKDLIEYATTNKHITKFCINSGNAGVARSWNIGAHLAEGKHLCFCNDDVEFSAPHAFSKLINLFGEHEKVGQVGPNGGKWYRDQSGERTGLKKLEDADEISGFFFIIPTDVFHESGGFDNEYTPAGCEEIDMSFKLRSMGYRCLVLPDTGIIHHGSHGVSAKKVIIKYFNNEIDTVALDKKNKQHFLNKWYK